jgi:hyperosmotically inducible protein
MKRYLAIMATSLLGLAPLALVGCASSMVPQNTRHTDSGITSMVDAALEANDKVKGKKIDVQTREGIVYMTGVVETEEARREAGRVAWHIEGVTGLSNDITVGERTIGSRIDDVMISSKVKSQLIGSSEVKSGDVDVSSSQGVVTLIGRVSTQSIKTEVERIARDVRGVTDVNNELLVGRIKP